MMTRPPECTAARHPGAGAGSNSGLCSSGQYTSEELRGCSSTGSGYRCPGYDGVTDNVTDVQASYMTEPEARKLILKQLLYPRYREH